MQEKYMFGLQIRTQLRTNVNRRQAWPPRNFSSCKFCFISTLWAVFTSFCALMKVQLAKMFYIGWAFIAMVRFLTIFWFVHLFRSVIRCSIHAEHGSKWPSTKQTKHGQIVLLVPGHDPPIDITIFMDIQPQPGPNTSDI